MDLLYTDRRLKITLPSSYTVFTRSKLTLSPTIINLDHASILASLPIVCTSDGKKTRIVAGIRYSRYKREASTIAYWSPLGPSLPFCLMAPEEAWSEWRAFITACFRKRLSSEKFSSVLVAFEAKYSTVPSARLAEVLLDAGCRDGDVDPRLPIFQEALLDSNRISVSSLLSSVQPRQSEDGVAKDTSLLDAQDPAKPSVQAVTLSLLSRKIVNGFIAKDSELFILLKALVPWMNHFPSSITLGFLVSATLGCPIAQEALPGAKAKSPMMPLIPIRLETY